MAKPQKSTAQSEVPGLVKKGPLYYLKRDWQLYALMLLPMVFIIVFKYFAYTGLSVAFLDYKIGKGYAGSKFVSGQCATYSFYMSSGTDVFSSLLANDPNAEVAVMGSTASGTVADGFTAHYYEYPSYGMIMGINANATAEERAATYMFLDWMSQPDNLKYLQYGEEGKTYNVVDGINVYNTDYTGDDKLSNNNNKDYWCLVQEVQHYGDEAADLQANKTTLAPAGYDWVVQDAYDLQKKGESGGIITPIFSKAVQATTEYSADLNSLWQEAYVDCVTCSPDEFESKYEEYCQEYLDAGYQEILDEKASLIADGNVLVVK